MGRSWNYVHVSVNEISNIVGDKCKKLNSLNMALEAISH